MATSHFAVGETHSTSHPIPKSYPVLATRGPTPGLWTLSVLWAALVCARMAHPFLNALLRWLLCLVNSSSDKTCSTVTSL